MKVRKEERGLHIYYRETGIHVLLDEYPIALAEADKGPTVISIALTNRCDLTCQFCYAPKSRHELMPDQIVRWCKELATLGTLEVAFGGGEPTLYRELPRICQAIWAETDLGISVTTHGRHLTDNLTSALENYISVIRVSIDAPEPYYSSIRGGTIQVVLENLKRLSGRIPFGINTVVNSKTLPHLDQLAETVHALGAVDWLLLPEISSGSFTLLPREWQIFDQWIGKYWHQLDLRVTAEAAPYLTVPILINDDLNPYLHISADGHVRNCSYDTGGVALDESGVRHAITKLREMCSVQAALIRRSHLP